MDPQKRKSHFVCEIKIYLYRLNCVYLQITHYFCEYDFTQHKCKIHVLGCEIFVYMFIYRSLQYTLDKIPQMCKKELTNVTWPTNSQEVICKCVKTVLCVEMDPQMRNSQFVCEIKRYLYRFNCVYLQIVRYLCICLFTDLRSTHWTKFHKCVKRNLQM
jgi:hypothetical protein